MFDEENFKLSVRLLSRHKLDVNKAEIVADMLEHYSEQKINRWLAKIATSNDPDCEFDYFFVVDEPMPIKPERMPEKKQGRRYSVYDQKSSGVEDASGLQGRYSFNLDFAQIFNDPSRFYGTWEETPPARRRFR